MIKTATRVQALKPSATLAISARADELIAKGEDIINLSLGEPDFPTPESICQAAIRAINEGQTKYTAVDGTPELKKAIINKFKRDNGLHYEPNQILASCGAKHVLFNLFMAVLNPGDEVIIPAPFWVSYPEMVQIAEAHPVIVPTSLDNHYKMTAAELEQAITPKTRMLIINSPSNPTGMCYSKPELQALAEVLRKHPDILIISDDIYEKIIWSKAPFTNLVMTCPEFYDRTVIVNGVSKTYAMTGWRIGYAAGPAAIIGTAKKIQSQSTSNPCSISQAAAVAALDGDEDWVKTMCGIFKARYDFFYEGLRALPNIILPPSEGAFYLFPRIDKVLEKHPNLKNDIDFAEFLLMKAKIACVPGTAFGQPGCIRFSYATDMENLDKALSRLREVILA